MSKNSSTGLGLEKDIPLVSVVLPVYNGGDFLADAIESILGQTFQEFELVAVDDGSTDESSLILKKYAERDSRVRVISRGNKGLPVTLNEAVDAARGEFIARMDQDDVSLPDRLGRQYDFMRDHPDVVVLGGAARFMDATGVPICTYHPPSDDLVLRNFFPNSPFIHPSVMFRKKDFIRAGKYPEMMKWGGEDIIIFGRFAKLGLLHNLDEPLVNYRLVPGSMSRKPPGFREILTKILECEIAGHPATTDQLSALQAEASRIDKSMALFDYYFELAKLCVWSGGEKRKTLRYLFECMKLHKFRAKVFFIFFLACMPATIVARLFYRIKGRRYKALNQV